MISTETVTAFSRDAKGNFAVAALITGVPALPVHAANTTSQLLPFAPYEHEIMSHGTVKAIRMVRDRWAAATLWLLWGFWRRHLSRVVNIFLLCAQFCRSG